VNDENRVPTFGFHAVYESDYFSGIKAAAEHGFQYVQFDLNVSTFFLDKLSHHHLEEIRKAADSLNIRIAFHAPGESIGLFTDSPQLRRGLIDQMKLILEKANHLNAHHLTVHLLRPPEFPRADTHEDELQSRHHEYYKRILQENLSELTKASGAMLITVENFYLEQIAVETLDEMFSRGTDIFLALDWAKLHRVDCTRDNEQYSFFQRHSDRIREIHIHDMDRMGKQHLVPGQGVLDFEPLMSKFYDGGQWLTVEVRPIAEAVKAKDSIQQKLKDLGGT
jgi:sugar phosphate isomerase/epimerase